MGDALTLPGTISGLLRRGSPIIIDNSHRGLVWGEHLDTGGIVIFDAHEASRRLVSAGRLALDLTDATGRAHAAWLLVRDHCAWFEEPVSVAPGMLTSAKGRTVYTVYTVDSDGADSYSWTDEHVPSLADLDPNGPRALPDGSRRVDAEALCRVILHVAGLST